MGAYSGVGAYLSSSGSEVRAYLGGEAFREWGHNLSFTLLKKELLPHLFFSLHSHQHFSLFHFCLLLKTFLSNKQPHLTFME